MRNSGKTGTLGKLLPSSWEMELLQGLRAGQGQGCGTGKAEGSTRRTAAREKGLLLDGAAHSPADPGVSGLSCFAPMLRQDRS